MSEWELIFLPSFEADVEKYQFDQEKLDKWFNDLQKKPDYINNAHALTGPLKPFWSAHFNEKINYIVMYLLCNGNQDHCFLQRDLSRFTYIDPETVKHECSKTNKRIYVFRFGTHKIYRE